MLIVGVPFRTANGGSVAYFQLFNVSEVAGHAPDVVRIAAAGGRRHDPRGRCRRAAGVRGEPSGRCARPHRRHCRSPAVELDTRLGATPIRILAVLTSAFNKMADRLQERIEREARFTSDVNHELRSPLTTVATALSVLEGRAATSSLSGPARHSTSSAPRCAASVASWTTSSRSLASTPASGTSTPRRSSLGPLVAYSRGGDPPCRHDRHPAGGGRSDG